MTFSFITSLAFSVLYYGVSLSESPPPFSRLPQNQWVVQNLRLGVQNSTMVEDNTGFELFRTKYRRCLEDQDPNGLLKQFPCGWINTNFPIYCGLNFIDEWKIRTLSNKISWSTCSVYPMGIDGETQVSEEAKQWIKWRVFEIQEYRKTDPDFPLDNIPFRSAKVQFVNGVPQTQSPTNTSVQAAPPMVKTFSTVFSFSGEDAKCSRGEGIIDKYVCEISGAGALALGPQAKITCDGRGLFSGSVNCKFSVNVTEETIPVGEFKERYS